MQAVGRLTPRWRIHVPLPRETFALTLKPCGASLSFVSTRGAPSHFYMPKFIIEREIPGAGTLTRDQLQGISQTSCGVLTALGPKIQWLESYVTADKVYCVYIAPDEATVREHARLGGFPANRVSQVCGMIDPTTAEA